MKCVDCKHFKDRYTLYMDGDFTQLQELLNKGTINSKDFMCEGFGCIFNPCFDFTKGKHDQFMQKLFGMEDGMEEKCENFELRNKEESILVKNIHKHIGKREYYIYKHQKPYYL